MGVFFYDVITYVIIDSIRENFLDLTSILFPFAFFLMLIMRPRAVSPLPLSFYKIWTIYGAYFTLLYENNQETSNKSHIFQAF